MKYSLLIILLLLFPINSVLAAGGGSAPPSNYMPIDPPFVVNVKNGSGFRFLQVNTELRLVKPELAEIVKHHMAAIRHNMIMLLSSQTAKDIETLEGKESLRAQALEAIQSVLKEETGEETVEAVYFTGFVIQ